MKLIDKGFISLMKYLPKRGLSSLTGKVMGYQAPAKVQALAVKAFAKAYGINTEEAELPLEDYKSLNEFFTRKLKPGARTPQGDLVHPADGWIISSGTVEKGQVLQVKGLTYELSEFLGDSQKAADFEGGTFWTLYLSPKDYHRVHFPLSGEVTEVRRVSGELWPVNSSFYKNFPGLFVKNERVALFMETHLGPAAVVMVGATNVGHIEVPLEGKAPGTVQVGEELGVFHLGSTVVTLLAKGAAPVPETGQKVQWGQKV